MRDLDQSRGPAEPELAESTSSSDSPAEATSGGEFIDAVPGDRTVCLTFDDGPHPVHTPRLLEVLRRHQVRAVFCLVGDRVRERPDLVRAIVADGHVLGNHSEHHDDLTDWSPERVEADLTATTAAIQEAAPGAAVPFFRAPFGAWGRSPEVAVRLRMAPLAWRLAVVDWQPPGTAVLVQRLRQGITPGAVVLLHDGGGDRSQTVDAVAALVPELADQGWTFTVPDPRGSAER
jgi:peptidoglycan/xylan/chitin deacetylase (PgdA/CDA1 family)